MVAMLILFDPKTRAGLANIVNYVFFPLFGFHYKYPVLTIFLAGSVVIIISALIIFQEQVLMQKMNVLIFGMKILVLGLLRLLIGYAR